MEAGCLVCGLRIANGIRVFLGEEGHSDSDFLLIFSYDRPQDGDQILFFLGILLVGYVPAELADEIDVVHEAGSPSKGDCLIMRRRGEYRNICTVSNRGSGPKVVPILTQEGVARVYCAPISTALRFPRDTLELFTKWTKLHSLDGDSSATLRAMTTKTIPEYLVDERKKHEDDQLRMEEEAARIQPLHRGHHRTANSPSWN